MSTWLRAESFAGRVGLVTGSAGGIGAAVCGALVAAGCTVVGCDLASDDLASDDLASDDLASGIEPAGDIARRIRTDVTVQTDVDAAVEASVEAFGGLDFVVGCAGVVLPGRLAEVTASSWRRSFAVNVDGMIHLARAAYPHLRRSPAPAAIAVASLSGLSAYPAGGGYGPSKAALISMARQLAVEWGPDGIRVNVVVPGPTLTPMLRRAQPVEYRAAQARRAPLGRLADPGEIADAVVYLLSSGARAVTGQVLAVDCGLGQTLLAGPGATS
ncbi:SDR family oxidoreductase [Pseudonocardia kujensis]|uniref:SDR family NAD(P)-dependent oxidoreductase n=1 Tax=Pseudonocardia kujensis TaxID=1128675 RepID=UPI001E387F7E|nr:SDR family oxidoreductase [Pseudonocardia kujensis]MCE0765579.1 SDR family oxidoreductase [Pseudonocardia kujensis]